MTAAAATEEDVPSLTYRPGLDGLRALAVGMVVWHHSLTIFMPTRVDLPIGGAYGVDVFFVLSGFLITRLLLAERERRGRISLRGFYERRARRLLPAFVLLMAVYVLVAAVAGYDRHIVLVSVLAAFTYSTNWVIAAGGFGTVSFDHLWSLAVEEQFYLVWPLAFGLLARRRALLAGTAAIVVITATWRVVLAFGSATPNPSVYMRTDARIDELLVGAVLAIALHNGWRVGRRQAQVAGVAGLAGITYLFFSHHGLRFPFVIGFPAVALCTSGVILAAIDAGSPLERALRWRPLVSVGRCSYALYLWHPLVMVLVYPFDLGPIGVQLAVAWLLSWGCAWCSTTFVEQPFRRRRPALEPAAALRPRERRAALGGLLRPGRRAPALGVLGVSMGLALAAGGLASAADRPATTDQRAITEAAARPATAGAPPPVAPAADAPAARATTASESSASTSAPSADGALAGAPDPGDGLRVPTLHLSTPVVEVDPLGGSATAAVAAQLLDDGGAPLPARRVAFTVDGAGCEAVTDAGGTARCTVALPAATAVPATVTAAFAGDDHLAPAQATLP